MELGRPSPRSRGPSHNGNAELRYKCIGRTLAPDLIFTNHFGQLRCKDDDLEAYRSGILKISELDPSEERVRVAGEAAIVSRRMRIMGTYGGNPANGDFRFTRVWVRSSHQTWQVVAAHAGIVS